MAKGLNVIESKTFRITTSAESFRLLHELATKGIYGKNEAEVAARFVERALEEYVERPKLKLRSSRLRSNEE